MVFRLAPLLAVVVGCCTLAQVQASELSRLYLDDLQAGQQIAVETEHAAYVFQWVDAATGETLARASLDGGPMAKTHRVYLLGSTWGAQPGDGGITLVLMRQLRVGMPMELGINTLDENDRRLSSKVKSIRLLGDQLVSLGQIDPSTLPRGPRVLPARQIGSAGRR
jgi:hypothetical protein